MAAGARERVAVGHAVGVDVRAVITIGLVATFLIAELYLKGIPGALPYPDAATTAFSLGAQYLLVRKRIENWLIWIAVDLAYLLVANTSAFPVGPSEVLDRYRAAAPPMSADEWAATVDLTMLIGLLLVSGAWTEMMLWLRSWLAATGWGSSVL